MAASSGVDKSSANLKVKNNNTEKKNDLLSLSVCPLTTSESALELATGTHQSAFIRRRSIHDNFLYTQNLIGALHKADRPSLFLKLDIAKAFDTVRWDYLMEVLEKLGFGIRWRTLISILLSTATSSVLLNGAQT